MKISKFLHSCVVLEEAGETILIDPGVFSFIEGKISPDIFTGISAVLITHEHDDHFYPEALRVILENNKDAEIYANRSVAARLEQEGIAARIIEHKVELGEFVIEAIPALHGPLPRPVPENTAFLINKSVLHPGDSLDKALLGLKVETLLLPVSAPWLKLVEVVDFAAALKPKTAVPIHDGFLKDFFRERLYKNCDNALKQSGILFMPF